MAPVVREGNKRRDLTLGGGRLGRADVVAEGVD